MEELSKLLNVAKNTIYRLADRGDIPCYHVGKALRFNKKDIGSCFLKQKGKPLLEEKEEEDFNR